MICRSCKRAIDEDSLFCKWCGKSQIISRRKKESSLISKPSQLKSGEWSGQLMLNGERIRLRADTEAEYYLKARAIKAGVIEVSKAPSKALLSAVVRNYIDSNSSTLSPATIRGYEIIYRNRFKAYMSMPVNKINFQKMVNDETKQVAPKTVINAWGLIASSLAAAGIDVPNVNKPKKPKSDEDWLDFEQIFIFLEAVKDDPVEVAALLALHSLRMSELLDLDVSQITVDGIVIRGATVPNAENKFVHKDTNKNATSTRTVPIMIPRLLEILPKTGKAVTLHPSTIRSRLLKVCSNAGLPLCTAHDLRRSFSSLAFHLDWSAQTTMAVGGWSNMQTVNAVYTKLSAKDKNADVEKMRAFYAGLVDNIT